MSDKATTNHDLMVKIDSLTQQIDVLITKSEQKDEKIDSLTKQINILVTESAEKDKQITHLTEQVAYLTRKLYGKSSEKDLNIDQSSEEDDDSPRC
ncbi:MAG: transposase [Muribaculum sp.]|nr:transposase [Muribaculum sp.]